MKTPPVMIAGICADSSPLPRGDFPRGAFTSQCDGRVMSVNAELPRQHLFVWYQVASNVQILYLAGRNQTTLERAVRGLDVLSNSLVFFN